MKVQFGSAPMNAVWWCEEHSAQINWSGSARYPMKCWRQTIQTKPKCKPVEMRLVPIDALASQVGEKPICGDSQHRHIGACELYTSQVGESE